MIKTCSKCGEEFLLKPDHNGFANICATCQLPRTLTKSELEVANRVLDEKNRILREENERNRILRLAERRQQLEAGWSPKERETNLIAYRKWIEDRIADDDESFLFFFTEMKLSRRRKFYS